MWAGVSVEQAIVGAGGTIAVAAFVGWTAPGDSDARSSKLLRSTGLGSVDWALVAFGACQAPPALRRMEAYGWASLAQAAAIMVVVAIALAVFNASRKTLRAWSRRRAQERGDRLLPPAYGPVGVAAAATLATALTTWFGSARSNLIPDFANDPVSSRVSALIPHSPLLFLLGIAMVIVGSAIYLVRRSRGLGVLLVGASVLGFVEILLGARGRPAIENARAFAFIGVALIAWAGWTLIKFGPTPAWRYAVAPRSRGRLYTRLFRPRRFPEKAVGWVWRRRLLRPVATWVQAQRDADPTSEWRRGLDGVSDDVILFLTEPWIVRLAFGVACTLVFPAVVLLWR